MSSAPASLPRDTPAPSRGLLLLAALAVGVGAGAWVAGDALLNHAVLSWSKFGFVLR